MRRTKARNVQTQKITDTVQTVLVTSSVGRFRQMLASYFEQERPVEKLTRRPQIGFRLPHGEYIFSVRPSWLSGTKEIDPETVLVEALRVELDDVGQQTTQRKKVMCLTLGPTNSKWTKWTYAFGQDALDNFTEMVGYFVLRPEEVFQRASDHCCRCGRCLHDQLSRTRGIGPECLRGVSAWLGWLAQAAEKEKEVILATRQQYLDETGFLPGFGSRKR